MKVMLLLRIKGQETSVLARQIYDESRTREWPGLAAEVTVICKEIGISDVNTVTVDKTTIKKAIWDHHQGEIKTELEKSKKLSDIRNEDFSKVQNYFNEKSLYKSRMAFKIRS